MSARPRTNAATDRGAVVTKALLRAADHLGVPNRQLARIVGLSEPTLSRMRNQGLTLAEDDKPFELALLFVRLYRSLDSIVGGDAEVARAWLKNPNTALNGTPLEQIQKVPGLVHVIDYLDSRRAAV